MSRRSEIELTNMCLVYNNDAVLVQEKTGTKYKSGLVFPKGHVEEGELLRDYIIREIQGRNRAYNFKSTAAWL